jgi:hypothetical protein
MTKQELLSCLARLSLSESETAQLLSVDPRTVRRWMANPAEIPGPAEQALRAWLRLAELGLAWRPDGLAIGEDDPEKIAAQIVAYRNHAIDLAAMLKRVKARGGPSAPWVVDLDKRCATLEAMKITFYPLQNGGFSPQTYTRRDTVPLDMDRDRYLIEDGYAAIARATAEAGPNWADRPPSTSKTKAKEKK